MTTKRIDDSAVLDMWVRGDRTDLIAGLFNVEASSICHVISKYRALGDPRAVHREMGVAYKAGSRMFSNIARYHRLRMLKRFPVDAADLTDAIAIYTGPITYCPPAVHLGYRPKCLDDIVALPAL